MRTNRLLILLATLILAYQAEAQCRLISNKYGSVYLTFERVGTIPVNEEHRAGMIFRFRNNSTCAVTISIEGSLDKPESYQLRGQRVLPDVLYWLRVGDRRNEDSGDAFGLVTVPGGRSALLGITFDVLDEPNGLIEVPFRYNWEDRLQKDGSAVTIEHLAYFAVSQIPKDVIAQYNAFRDKKYPVHWFSPVNDPNKPDWEILPQEAGPGEVILSKRNELGILSNFAATPFELYGKQYASVEGFWQMMLYPEGPDDARAKAKDVEWKFTRGQIAQMTAFEAKSAGTLAEENMKKLGIDWCTFNGKSFPYRSSTPGEHYRLILAAMHAKVEQNPEVRRQRRELRVRILLATGDLILRPDHHGEENPPLEWQYYYIWMQLRTELQKPVH